MSELKLSGSSPFAQWGYGFTGQEDFHAFRNGSQERAARERKWQPLDLGREALDVLGCVVSIILMSAYRLSSLFSELLFSTSYPNTSQAPVGLEPIC